MPAYSYKAFDISGNKTNGKIESPDQQAAISTLKKKGIYVVRIHEADNSIWKREIELGPKRIPSKEFVPFLRQFATLYKAGVTIVESLRILSEQTSNKKLKKILVECAGKVARGHQLSEAFREHQAAFPPVFVNMVRAGEITGNLEDVLDKLASLLEKEHYTREKVKSALTYPAVIAVVALIVTGFLLVNVIPKFVLNLKKAGGTLPMSTKIVLGLSDHLVLMWHWYVVGFLLLFLLYRMIGRTKKGRYVFDTLILRMPIFGKLFQKAAIARCSRTMATLLQSAVPALQVFTVAANVVGNEVYARTLRESRDALRSGHSMVWPIKQQKMFPPLVTQMIAIGEQTGNLDAMFGKIADFYEADVETTVDKIRPLIEPLMILVLAVVVGVIVMATIAPIFSMYSNIGK